MTEVGIDAVEIWSGKLKLDLPGTFAPEKDDDPEQYTKDLGLTNSLFPDVHEDIVTTGANAAKQLMDRKDLTPEASDGSTSPPSRHSTTRNRCRHTSRTDSAPPASGRVLSHPATANALLSDRQ